MVGILYYNRTQALFNLAENAMTYATTEMNELHKKEK